MHISSKHNTVSDFFSRQHEVNVITQLSPSVSLEDWYDAQQECQFISSACAYVKSKKLFNVIRLGPLKQFRKFLSLNKNGLLQWKNKIVVPDKFRGKILEMAHDHPTSGHFGEDRTWKAVTKQFFWPNVHNVQRCKETGGQLRP